MTYTLTVCYGMFLAICGQVRTFDFPDTASCERERTEQLKRVGAGYAVCAPKTTPPPKQ
jgi:hypothetical protein